MGETTSDPALHRIIRTAREAGRNGLEVGRPWIMPWARWIKEKASDPAGLSCIWLSLTLAGWGRGKPFCVVTHRPRLTSRQQRQPFDK